MKQSTEPTTEQQAAWDQYQQARRDAGLPVVVEVQASGLRRGDVLAGGGTLTSDAHPHPCGAVAAEVDYRTVSAWASERMVAIYERDGGRR